MLTNIERLRERVNQFSNHKQFATYVCVGYGDNVSDLEHQFNIPYKDLHADYSFNPNGSLNAGWTGSMTDKLYYVTEEFYNKYIKEEDTMPADKKSMYKESCANFIKLTGLKVGSKVRVTHKAKSYQHGWPSQWCSKMDSFVGKEYTVIYIESFDKDFQLDDGGDSFFFPFFVLEVIEDEDIVIPLESGDYEAKVHPDGNITVGCQKINFSKLEEIYNAALKQKNN